jgi:hypothetical protein
LGVKVHVCKGNTPHETVPSELNHTALMPRQSVHSPFPISPLKAGVK